MLLSLEKFASASTLSFRSKSTRYAPANTAAEATWRISAAPTPPLRPSEGMGVIIGKLSPLPDREDEDVEVPDTIWNEKGAVLCSNSCSSFTALVRTRFPVVFIGASISLNTDGFWSMGRTVMMTPALSGAALG